MKRLGKHLVFVLLLGLTVLLLFTACKDTPTPTDTAPDTTAAETPTEAEGTTAPDTPPADTVPDETDPAESSPDGSTPSDTAPEPDGIHIPDPSVNVEYTPKDGVLAQMGIFDGKTLGDAVGYAATMLAGGEIGSCEVIHKGKTYTIPA